jgi:hypothetical protein
LTFVFLLSLQIDLRFFESFPQSLDVVSDIFSVPPPSGLICELVIGIVQVPDVPGIHDMPGVVANGPTFLSVKAEDVDRTFLVTPVDSGVLLDLIEHISIVSFLMVRLK